MEVPVCECERGKKRSTTSIMQCEILYLFAWVVLWMQTRKKASASCVSVRDSPLSSVCECERGKKRSTTSIMLCEIPISILRMGRFVDANEEESECELCEREGFTTFVRL